MRIKVTKGGLYGANGEIPVGTTATVKDIPESWKHFVTVLEDDPSEDHEAITGEETEVTEPSSDEDEQPEDPDSGEDDAGEDDAGEDEADEEAQPSRRRSRR